MNFEDRLKNNNFEGLYLPEELKVNNKAIKDALIFLETAEKTNNFKELNFVILGEPKAWNRAVKTKTHYYDSNVGVKAYVANEVIRQCGDNFTPFLGEALLELVLYKPIPKSMPKAKQILAELGYIRPISKPDFDNYAKNVCDTLNNILFNDDAQITVGVIEKRYSFKPRYEFKIMYRERTLL
jgi:Holliday junction resolvase RusA-like endonuclease